MVLFFLSPSSLKFLSSLTGAAKDAGRKAEGGAKEAGNKVSEAASGTANDLKGKTA